MDEIKILLVDDHQVIIDGLNALLSGVEGMRVVSTANNGKEALEILNILSVDVVVMDIDMPVLNGLETTIKIREKGLNVKVLILSMHCNKGMINQLIETGVDGYLIKNSGKDEITSTIRKVAAGEKYFSSDVTISLSQTDTANKTGDKNPVTDLSDREIEILKLISEGYTNKEIGQKLFISHRTVDTHRTNMMKKIGVNNIAGLISYAIKNGIVD